MLRKTAKMVTILFVASITLSSCYSYKTVVGSGAKGNQQKTEWNHYLIGGLIPVGVSDSKRMSGGVEDYSVHTRQTFVNGLLSALTGGLYAPTTTTVTK